MYRTIYINGFYQKLCDAFVDGIDPADENDMRDAYLKYLHGYYDRYFNEVPDEESELKKIASFCARREKVVNLSKDKDGKKAFLFPDENYLKLESLSFEIAGIAQDKKDNKSIDPPMSKEEYTDKLRQLFDSVSELFKYSAERVYSEAMVELGYIFDGGEMFSFRMHNF